MNQKDYLDVNVRDVEKDLRSIGIEAYEIVLGADSGNLVTVKVFGKYNNLNVVDKKGKKDDR